MAARSAGQRFQRQPVLDVPVAALDNLRGWSVETTCRMSLLHQVQTIGVASQWRSWKAAVWTPIGTFDWRKEPMAARVQVFMVIVGGSIWWGLPKLRYELSVERWFFIVSALFIVKKCGTMVAWLS